MRPLISNQTFDKLARVFSATPMRLVEPDDSNFIIITSLLSVMGESEGRLESEVYESVVPNRVPSINKISSRLHSMCAQRKYFPNCNRPFTALSARFRHTQNSENKNNNNPENGEENLMIIHFCGAYSGTAKIVAYQ